MRNEQALGNDPTRPEQCHGLGLAVERGEDRSGDATAATKGTGSASTNPAQGATGQPNAGNPGAIQDDEITGAWI